MNPKQIMESESKKHKVSGECIDRLSEMPDEVLVHILSFLPTIDAVRTVLIRRFGNLWTLVPSLWFYDDDDNWEHVKPLFAPFSRFVYNVLVLHRRPTIETFCIEVSDLSWKVADESSAKIAIEVWIRFALSRQAKDLLVDLHHGAPFPVPASIFASQSLVWLKLEQCRIRLPTRAHMGSLKTFVLDHVVLEEGDLNDFVVGCPSLQELIVDNVQGQGFRALSFSAPSIEKLELWDGDPTPLWKVNCPNLKILVFAVHFHVVEDVNSPSVRELTIGDYDTECGEDARRFKSFLEGFPNVEVLTLSEEAVLQLTYCLMVNVRLPQNRWKCVVLRSSVLNTNVAGICNLVKNSPCLQELIIHVDQNEAMPSTGVSNLVLDEASSPCEAPILKIISMHGYEQPYDGLLRLVEFLLKSAVNLDKLVIFSYQGSQIASAEELQFVKKISNFPRASTEARIVFEQRQGLSKCSNCGSCM